VGCAAFFFGETLLSYIYDHHLQEATPVFGWLMASVICFSLQYIFGTLITAAGDLRPMIYMALGAMIYNILLNTFYIPELGALGAARASFFTQFMVLVAQIIVVRDRFSIGNFQPTLLRAILFAAATLCVGFIFSTSTISQLPVAYNIALFTVSSVLLMAMTKILDWKGFIQLMKSRE
jgi:O-antigen/teichoic acid export membrane protein